MSAGQSPIEAIIIMTGVEVCVRPRCYSVIKSAWGGGRAG